MSDRPILRPRTGVVGCDAWRTPEITVHVCRGCGKQEATYAGAYPRTWEVLAGHDFCRRCQKRARR